MRMMLLAAGLGERMFPLTLTLPKPAIPVLGRPLAIQILHRLAQFGVDRAVLNLHHLPEVLTRLLGNGASVGLPTVEFTYEPTILGTGGGLRNAAGLLRGDGPILVNNSDFLADIDITAAMQAHLGSGHAATLVLAQARPQYARVDVDGSGNVLSIGGVPRPDHERVTSSYLFTGCHIINEDVLDRIPADGASSIVDVYRDLVRTGQLGYYAHPGFWWEFGAPSLYLAGTLELLDLSTDQRLPILQHDPVRRVGGAVAALGAGAEIDPDAQLEGRLALGFASRVGADCVIRDSVVMPEAWIGPGCRLVETIVAQGVEVPSGFEARRALVCADPDPRVHLASATRREAGLLVHALDAPPIR